MDTPRFIFRGDVVGTAGHIHKPDDTILWVQGASSLPVIGGYSKSAVDRVAFGNYLSADSVKTQANGDFSAKDKAFKAIATSEVSKVNIINRLSAELLDATLISSHPADGSQPSIVPTGTAIKNLRLDGYPVDVTLDVDLFTKYGTMDSLSQAYSNDDAFYSRYGKRFMSTQRDPAKAAKGRRQIPTVAGYVICSIVDKVRTDHPKVTIDGNVISLPGFGTIYLGELLITSVSRRLTLLRVKLGSPTSPRADPGSAGLLSADQGSLIEGDMACAEVENNGIMITF